MLRVPQPCHESWAAMTPTALGRHCAACQKTVVDFTHQTDAEILAYLAKATGETCGRFYNDQLERPLKPVPPLPQGSRWRAWLALLLATWGTTRAVAASHPAAHPTHSVPRSTSARPRTSTLATKYVQGLVRDAATGAPLVGVAVFLRGENRMVTTDSAGRFRLRLSPRRPRGGRALVLHFTGYRSITQSLAATTRATTSLALALPPDAAAAGVEVVGYQPVIRREVTGGAVSNIIACEVGQSPKPQLSRPRSFFGWLKARLHRAPATE